MTYPNMDLQSLPNAIDTRVGTDPVERALQLAYWQCFAALQAVDNIINLGQYPELVEDAEETANFDTTIGTLRGELVSAIEDFVTIWSYVP